MTSTHRCDVRAPNPKRPMGEICCYSPALFQVIAPGDLFHTDIRIWSCREHLGYVVDTYGPARTEIFRATAPSPARRVVP